VLALALALVLVGGAHPTSAGASYTVDSVLDEPAANPSSTVCDSSPSHVCTLRAAVEAANASSDATTIEVPAGVYTLGLGELVVGSATNLDTTIVGLTGDPADVVVTQAGAGRVFETTSLAVLQATFDSLTISGGNAPDTGGGLLAGSGTTTIVHSIVTGNSSAADGGGIAALGGGSLTISSTSIVDNSAGEAGGGLFVDDSTVAATTIAFVGDHASGGGGAAALEDGSLNVTFSRFARNAAADGAAVLVDGGTAGLDDDWWGASGGPAPGDVANATIARWLRLRVAADPNPILVGGQTTLSADLLGRNTGGPVDPAALAGLPAFPQPAAAVFGNPRLGTLSGGATQFVDGRATAEFDAGPDAGSGAADVTADDQTSTVAIEIGEPPAITTQPSSLAACAGSSVEFSAAAAGSPTPNVQWQVSADHEASWTDIGGATSATLALTPQTGDDGNEYRAVFTNPEGTATSNPATLTVQPGPAVTTDPITQAVAAGQTASFTASGENATGLQWQVSTDGGSTWSDVPGATGPRLTLTAQAGDDGSRYRAAFTNGCGTVYSQPASLFVGTSPPPGVNLPSGFSEARVATGFRDPTTVAIAPDGRIFVVEQGGTIRIIENGVLLPTPFLKLSNIDEQGERGLQSIAFDPRFETNHYIYVFYAATDPVIHNRVSRFTASGDVADPHSEVDLIDIEPATSTYHNGGMLRFGRDGDLYIATGDNLTSTNAQDLTNLKGKILRIEPDGTIPADNPFVDKTTGPRRAIWAMGLRNPYTFSFQAGTGRMFIDDVGLHTWEEIDEGVAGGNYGWPVHEGPSSDPGYLSPLYAYLHGDGPDQGCAIIGGAFYNPAVASWPPRYVGRYLFADYCNGWIHMLDPASGNVTDFASNGVRITGLTLDPGTGDVYYLSRPIFHGTSGDLYRISYVGDDLPRVDIQPDDVTVAVGQDAAFTVVPTGGKPYSYQWQRDGVDIPGATADTYTLTGTQAGDDGATFDVVVTNPSGSATSRAARLTVTPDEPPVVTITSPLATKTYKAGDVISFAGAATDPEDGVEPARRFTWTVVFHHRDHEHPFMPPTSGIKKGSFTVPLSDFETDYDVYFHIILTVADSAGLSTTVTRDVHPKLATVTVATSPAGLSAVLDGTPLPTPLSFVGVVGFQRSLGVGSPQALNGRAWAFDSWSDGGAQTHTIATPAKSSTYTAVFRVDGGSVGTGTGLTATYYDTSDFTGPSVTRIDPTVNFRWASNIAPAPGIGPPAYSVRWTGALQAQFTQKYTLALRSDEGARLLIDGNVVIDDMTPHSARTDKATVALVAGERHAIEIDYFNVTGTGQARLSWQSASTPLSLIPSSQLYP
jgi:CSLREA domain-containing protein